MPAHMARSMSDTRIPVAALSLIAATAACVVAGSQESAGVALELFYDPNIAPPMRSSPDVAWNSAPMTDQNLANNAHWLRSVDEPIVAESGWEWPKSQGAAKTYIFTKQMSTVRILGGWSASMARNATGGPMVYDVVYRCKGNDSLCYRLDLLWDRLDPIVQNHIRPVLVLDNVPYCFVKNASVGTYGQNQAPDDPKEYGGAIAHLVSAIVSRYGEADVRQWMWRVATEPNTAPGHWASTPEQYNEMYDWVVAGIWSVLPGAAVGPGNFCPFYIEDMGCWRTLESVVEPIIDHLASGTNAATGKNNSDLMGSNVAFLAMSYYASYAVRRPGNEDSGYDPVNGAISAMGLQLLQHRHPEQLGHLPTYFFEYGTLSDKLRNVSNEPGSFGGAWRLASSAQAFAHNISDIFHWGNAEGFPVKGVAVQTFLQSNGWVQSALNGLHDAQQPAVLVAMTASQEAARSARMSSPGALGGDSASVLASRVPIGYQASSSHVISCPVGSLLLPSDDAAASESESVTLCTMPEASLVSRGANVSASGIGASLPGSVVGFAVSVFSTDRLATGTVSVKLGWSCSDEAAGNISSSSPQTAGATSCSSGGLAASMQQLNASSSPYDAIATSGVAKGWVHPWVGPYRYGLRQMLTLEAQEELEAGAGSELYDLQEQSLTIYPVGGSPACDATSGSCSLEIEVPVHSVSVVRVHPTP